MKTNEVKKEDIINFILSQPDDRPVDLGENYSSDECGCVMIHYGKERLNLTDFGCGFGTWETEVGFEHCLEKKGNIFDIVNFDGNSSTYKDLKEQVLANVSNRGIVDVHSSLPVTEESVRKFEDGPLAAVSEQITKFNSDENNER